MSWNISLDYVLETEFDTLKLTDNELGGFIGIFEDAIETFYELTHYFRTYSDNPDSPMGEFNFFCSMHYLQAPYTFFSVYSIWRKGYYYESVILLRHLVESFVQMRYFQNKTEKIVSFIKREKRITFKTMFDTHAPGLYELFYSQLSNFAHGGLFKDIFRVEQDSKGRNVVIGCKYDENKATYVINIINVIFLGYLKYFPVFFPGSYINMEKDKFMWDRFNRAVSNMMEAVDSHQRCHPISKNWYDLILPLVM